MRNGSDLQGMDGFSVQSESIGTDVLLEALMELSYDGEISSSQYEKSGISESCISLPSSSASLLAQDKVERFHWQ